MPHSAAPPAPAVAHDVFGGRLPVAERYAALLAGPGVERGLIGPREAGRLWERHLLNCAVAGELVPEGSTVVDVGSGAGLPGIVIAILRPDVRMTLLEPLLRRATFLTECVAELGLNVEVRRARAEEAADLAVDVVTARAVAPLGRLAEWTLPLLVPGGRLLAFKGDRAEAELGDAGPVLGEFDVRSAEVVRIGHSRVDPPATVVRVIAGQGRRQSGSREGTRRGGRASAARRRGNGRGGERGAGSRRQGDGMGQAESRRKR